MAVASTLAAVVPTAIKFPSASRFIASTSKVSIASRISSKCACSRMKSRWTFLRGTKLAYSSWNISPVKQSLKKGLVFAMAVSDYPACGDSSLYPEASRSVLGIILGGGAGTRLYPLTMKRAKPAVPIGANYRLIDIPVSNCINSNINKVYVLTQYNSASLNRHVSRAYANHVGGHKNKGFVECLAAQQSPENPNWFQGTADAVRQYLWLFEEADVMEFVVLAGDHLYRMDYQKFIQVHRETNADITVAALPVDETRATAFGLMKIDDVGRIYEFAEKPEGDKLWAMQVDTTRLGLAADRAKVNPYIASMGIYVVRKETMISLLRNDFPEANDFGSEVIPGATKMGLKNAKIFHSSLGFRSWIGEGAVIEDSLLMGADYYETDEQRSELLSSRGIPMGVGRNSVVRKAIIDKNARIGENVKIENVDGVREADRLSEGFFIRSGLVTIFKDATIPHGTII